MLGKGREFPGAPNSRLAYAGLDLVARLSACPSHCPPLFPQSPSHQASGCRQEKPQSTWWDQRDLQLVPWGFVLLGHESEKHH